MNSSLPKLARFAVWSGVWISLLAAPGLPRAQAAATIVTNMTWQTLVAALAGGGTVQFTNSGTIAFSDTIPVTAGTTLEAMGHQVILSGGGSTNRDTTNGVRLFLVSPGVNFTLNGLTLANGRSTQGGAIVNQGTLTLTNCVLTNNGAIGLDGFPGATGADGSEYGARGADGGNGQDGLGGALWNEGTATIQGCTFQNNLAAGGHGGRGGTGGNGFFRGGDGGTGGQGARGWGGAVYSSGALAITNSTFGSNAAHGGEGGTGGTNGAGFYLSYLGSGGRGEHAAGGAIYSVGDCALDGTIMMENQVQAGSSAKERNREDFTGVAGLPGADGQGGGICNAGGNTLVNCTFYANTVTAGNGGDGGDGLHLGGQGGAGGTASGGNYFNGGVARFLNCTFSSGNTLSGLPGSGGAGGSDNGADGANGSARGDNVANTGASLALTNSIVAYWVSSGNYFGPVTDGGNNLSSDGTPTFSHPTSRNHTDPLLEQPGNNGGPTWTMALLTNSPAIDVIPTNAFDYAATDQRGVDRPWPVAGNCDIGAFEFGADALPPYFTVQPTNQAAARGTNLVLVATARSDVASTFVWSFRPAGAQQFINLRTNQIEIPGVNTDQYALNNVQTNHAGSYQVMVYNRFGAVTSQPPATVTVTIPLAILVQPTNRTVILGDDVEFSVAAESSNPINYQWLFNGAAVPLATSSKLTLTDVSADQAGEYWVNLSSGTAQLPSAKARLVVRNPFPVITTAPATTNVFEGNPAGFSVAATGEPPLSYQWRFNGTALAGATATNYSIASVSTLNAGVYDVVVTNQYAAVTSSLAQLIVSTPLRIASQSASQIVPTGSNVELLVNVQGRGPFEYQWRRGETLLLGANGNNLLLREVKTSQAGRYEVEVWNGYSERVVSDPMDVTVFLPLSDRLVSPGEAVAFVLTAFGPNPLAYQWSLNGSNIPHATNHTYSISNVQPGDAGEYRVTVVDSMTLATQHPSATLTLPPELRPAWAATNFSVSFGCTAGMSYVLESADDLSATNWTAVVTTNAVAPAMTLVDPRATRAARFYRIRFATP